jgi:hypothetical protein
MTTDEITDEQRAEGFAVLKKLIAGEKVDRPAWMAEAREREDRIQAAMQKHLGARDHAPAQAATAATFRTDPEDLPAAHQKSDQPQQPDPAATKTDPIPEFSEDDLMVFTDDLGEKVR